MEKSFLFVGIFFLLLFNIFGFIGASCIDYEDGKDIHVKGVVEYHDPDPRAIVSIRTKEDICFNETVLYEVYCDEYIITKEVYTCPITSICEDGACGKCNPIGFRTDGMYCSLEGIFQPQKTLGIEGNWSKCENHHECESNFCVEEECISRSFIRSAIEWIKNFFGGE